MQLKGATPSWLRRVSNCTDVYALAGATRKADAPMTTTASGAEVVVIRYATQQLLSQWQSALACSLCGGCQ
eukprot:9367-Heterococcus_DN1.PRE.4